METKNKIVKMSKVCHIVSKVLYIVAFVACLAFIALAIALPLADVIDKYTKSEVAVIFSTLAVYAFVCIGLLWNVEGIFKSIVKEGTPFCKGVSHYLKKSAIFVLILAVVPALIGTTVLRIACPETELIFPVSISGIVVGAVLLILGIIFKYGNELQNRDDETL